MSVAEAPPIRSVDDVETPELYEIVNGVRVEVPPMSAFASRLASRLARHMNNVAEPLDAGEAVTETLFRLPLANEQERRPDVAYVSAKRWPLDRELLIAPRAWDVVPDLVVEVVSPSDKIEDLEEKLMEYFEAGVTTVWVVYPRSKTVHVYDSLDKVRAVREPHELDGGTVLPGFKLPIATLFAAKPLPTPKP
jgi:Uma2 family endonuclease